MCELIKVDKKIEKILEIVDYEELYKLVKEDRVIGYGTINKDKENLIYIFIEDSLRGNGYGTFLFSEMLEKAKSKGYKKVEIIFREENTQILKIVKGVEGVHLSTLEGKSKYLIPIV